MLATATVVLLGMFPVAFKPKAAAGLTITVLLVGKVPLEPIASTPPRMFVPPV